MAETHQEVALSNVCESCGEREEFLLTFHYNNDGAVWVEVVCGNCDAKWIVKGKRVKGE